MFRYLLDKILGTDSTPEPQDARPTRVARPTPQAGSHRPSQERSTKSQRDLLKKTSSILFIGRSGSGKTSFVEAACTGRELAPNMRSIKPTEEVVSQSVDFPRRRFQLIDTPGFDNSTMNNLDTFGRLADYFLQERISISARLTNIIYIHRVGDLLESRALAQNLGVLFDVFLGDSGLSRLTIMVVPDKPGMQAPNSAAQALSRSSVFRPAISKGAKVLASTLRQTDIESILMACSERDPVLLQVQQTSVSNMRAMLRIQIEERLNHHGGESTRLHNDVRTKLDLASFEKKVPSFDSILEAKEREISQLSHSHKQSQQQLARNQRETALLSEQFRQTQKEYASLRSQLQLHENIEQGDIVQALKDLNRSIDDLSRSISQHVVDTYAEAVFGKQPSDITAVEARDLPKLKALLGHVEGRSSLVTMSDGTGMPVEDFLDFAIRCLLCDYLSVAIFRPFHPAADSSQNTIVAAMYQSLQREGNLVTLAPSSRAYCYLPVVSAIVESQALAARWRANSFQHMHRFETPDAVTQHVNLIVQGFINASLLPVLTHVFGEKSGIRLENQHLDHLTRLFGTAWDWNTTLKQEVIMLGDFQPTYYAPLLRFDPGLMHEFEADRRKSQPKHILGTLGLGLLSFHAIGGGKTPEELVVLPATVATKSLYA
ncbi:hypothetical protein FRC12_006093 [Ceratobasidium sp. 428]|nr:hypothetical protein FRC12_006093 [Ceratobasidium sp. 428]